MDKSIKSSNQEILELIELNPNSGIIKVLKEWKIQRQLKDYHTTLELIASKLGLSLLMELKNNGWIPYFDYKPKNLIGEREGRFALTESSFKSIEKCQKYLTKETIYKLMRIYNIEEILK